MTTLRIASLRLSRPAPSILRSFLACAVVLAAGALPAAEPGFEATAASAQRDLERSLADLAKLREEIAAEKLPLTRELRQLEERLVERRETLQSLGRDLDGTNLSLTNLRSATESGEQERQYLSSLLDEYVRNFESRVHIVEHERWAERAGAARAAVERQDRVEGFRVQLDLVDASIDRLADLTGGSRFDGTAVGAGGVVEDVTFALVGPIALYRTKNGSSAGLAEQRLGSLEPNMFPLDDAALVAEASSLVTTGVGRMPFDPSLGAARQIEATEHTLVEHAMAGGPVMIPILLLAGAAFVVALYKWYQLVRVRKPASRQVSSFLEATQRGDLAEAGRRAAKIDGPTGDMLRAGLAEVGRPKDYIEEVMFERMLDTRLALQGMLPFIAVCAAAAPLLGLLGTVTGIINTFKMITVFGTGDPKTLSSGISEALITTEFGLIIAIPSLLLHAFLSRKARRFIDSMEKTAISFLNRIHVDPVLPARQTVEPVRELVSTGPSPRLGRPVTAEALDH
jgi:biopolymer transport protein ExbB